MAWPISAGTGPQELHMQRHSSGFAIVWYLDMGNQRGRGSGGAGKCTAQHWGHSTCLINTVGIADSGDGLLLWSRQTTAITAANSAVTAAAVALFIRGCSRVVIWRRPLHCIVNSAREVSITFLPLQLSHTEWGGFLTIPFEQIQNKNTFEDQCGFCLS